MARGPEKVVINDHLANGAGFTPWVNEHWRDLFWHSIVTSDPPPRSFMAALISEEHRLTCQSAGYDCLRQYRNMSYHGLLDWRLGDVTGAVHRRWIP